MYCSFLHSDLKDDIAVQDYLKDLTKEELKPLFRCRLSTATVENRYEGTSVMAYKRLFSEEVDFAR